MQSLKETTLQSRMTERIGGKVLEIVTGVVRHISTFAYLLVKFTMMMVIE